MSKTKKMVICLTAGLVAIGIIVAVAITLGVSAQTAEDGSINECFHNECTEETVPATCTDSGYTIRKCKECNNEEITLEGQATGHSIGTFVVTTNTHNYTCINCGEYIEEEHSSISESGNCEVCHYGLEYKFSSFTNTYSVTGVSEGATIINLVVPTAYNGYAVSVVVENAFANNNTIETVYISDTVSEIESGAFSGCTAIEEMTLPFVGSGISASDYNKLNMFGYIFSNKSYGGGVAIEQADYTFYIPSTLKTVTITSGEIYEYAFYKCISIESITLSDGVTSIGEYAFYGCKSLASITFSNSIESIGNYAFNGCENLVIYYTDDPSDFSSIKMEYKEIGCNQVKYVY